jgi:hypothetical protein
VATYLVELYLPGTGAGELPSVAARAHAGALQMSSDGTPMRFLRSIIVPGDETCFLLFEAPCQQTVRETVEQAGISFTRVMEAVDFEATAAARQDDQP